MSGFHSPHLRAASEYGPTPRTGPPPAGIARTDAGIRQTAGRSWPSCSRGPSPPASPARAAARPAHLSSYARGTPVYLKSCVGDREPVEFPPRYRLDRGIFLTYPSREVLPVRLDKPLAAVREIAHDSVRGRGRKSQLQKKNRGGKKK